MSNVINILYKDRYISVVYKPHGLQTEPDKMGHPDLCTELKKQLNRANEPRKIIQPVNRLDRPVSGLVLFAHTSAALKALNKMQENREIKKEYRALVTGFLEPKKGEWSHFIVKDLLLKKAIVSNRFTQRSKPCSLVYEVIEKSENFSRLSIELKTGRYHQIRAQAAFCGHPILGDVHYGSLHSMPEKGIALHAYRLTFFHPISREKVDFKHPEDF